MSNLISASQNVLETVKSTKRQLTLSKLIELSCYVYSYTMRKAPSSMIKKWEKSWFMSGHQRSLTYVDLWCHPLTHKFTKSTDRASGSQRRIHRFLKRWATIWGKKAIWLGGGGGGGGGGGVRTSMISTSQTDITFFKKKNMGNSRSDHWTQFTCWGQIWKCVIFPEQWPLSAHILKWFTGAEFEFSIRNWFKNTIITKKVMSGHQRSLT